MAPAWRLLRVLEHLLTGTILASGVALTCLARRPRPWLPALVTWWLRRLWRCLALEVCCRGTPAQGALLVANHVSWLDVPVLGGATPLRFVSKAEVRQWPLVGWLAATAGTLFLQRGAHQSSAMALVVARELQRGTSIAIFPEGTTSDGRALGRFHARLFAAVEHNGAPVQPVAIRYGRGAEPDETAPFIGEDNLLAHLWRVLRHPALTVDVAFLPPMPATEMRRRELADAARAAIASHLSSYADGALPTRAEQGVQAARALSSLDRAQAQPMHPGEG